MLCQLLLTVCVLSGACISLMDPTLTVTVESCPRSFMKAFCCDSYSTGMRPFYWSWCMSCLCVLQESMSFRIPVCSGHDHSNRPGHHQLPDWHERDRMCSDNRGQTSGTLQYFKRNALVALYCGLSDLLSVLGDKARTVMQQGRPPTVGTAARPMLWREIRCIQSFTTPLTSAWPNILVGTLKVK